MERQTITGRLSTSGRLSGNLSVGGTTDYNELENKPTYNGHIIEGELTNESLGIWQPKNFSTEEQNTGLKWIDGRDIYQKIYQIEASTNWTTLTNIGTWDNTNEIIDIKANIVENGNYYMLPYASASNTAQIVFSNNGIIMIAISGTSFSAGSILKITLQYVKNN